MLKAREGILYSRGDDRSIEALKSRFDDYCPEPKLPYEQNPFFTCVQRAGLYTDVSSVKLKHLLVISYHKLIKVKQKKNNNNNNSVFTNVNVIYLI